MTTQNKKARESTKNERPENLPPCIYTDVVRIGAFAFTWVEAHPIFPNFQTGYHHLESLSTPLRLRIFIGIPTILYTIIYFSDFFSDSLEAFCPWMWGLYGDKDSFKVSIEDTLIQWWAMFVRTESGSGIYFPFHQNPNAWSNFYIIKKETEL